MAAYTTLERPALQQTVPGSKKKEKKVWNKKSLFAFRIAFIYFVLFSIPVDVGFYKMILHIDYAHLNYRHTNEVFAFYNPQFINHFSEGGFFGWQSYINLVFILVEGAYYYLSMVSDKSEYNSRIEHYQKTVLSMLNVKEEALVLKETEP